jgi:hypothetical protein
MRFVGYLIRLGTVAVVVALSLALATGVLAGGRPLGTALSGANEVPPADPDGTGVARVWLNQGRGTVCWSIHVENITLPAIGAHIHSAAAGVNGPVVVPLSAPDAEGNAVGCATGVDRALIKAIRQHPRQYYVNVHTTDFPGGAVRGQLSWHAKPQ